MIVRCFVATPVAAMCRYAHCYDRCSGIEAIAVEHLDILLGHHLPQVFVADTPCGVACAGLFGTKNSEVDFGRQQDFGNGGRHLLVALVERTHAANPVEDIGVGIFRHQRHTQTSSPFSAFIVADLPGIGVALNVVKERGDFRREFALFHHQVAAHIDDFWHMLDGDRADLHTGATGRTGPQRVIGNDAADHRLVMGLFLVWRSRRL